MSSRFFLPDLSGTHATIDDTQVHHIRNVMRLDIGDRVILFDGRNLQAVAEIEAITRSQVQFRIVETQAISCELASSIVVAMPLPKTERIRFLVEKLTELGVSRFIPVLTDRSEFNVKAASTEKLMRYVVEASKQCGRNALMEIESPEKLNHFLERAGQSSASKWIAQRDGDDLDPEDVRNADESWVLIGPEGGFTDAEVDMAREQEFIPVSLGPAILRMETAAFKLASLLSLA